EYLAIVTHYAWRREADGAAGLFQKMAGRWLVVLAAFVLILGLSDFVFTQTVAEWWFALNLWAAFLHYTYDGMIWKLRRPATARALGIDLPAGTATLASGRGLETTPQHGLETTPQRESLAAPNSQEVGS